MRRGRSICHEHELEVVDDAIDHGEICKEGNDAHLTPTLRTEEWVDFINLTNHLGPATAWDLRALFLDEDELMFGLL
jgi:hypothetical protein